MSGKRTESTPQPESCSCDEEDRKRGGFGNRITAGTGPEIQVIEVVTVRIGGNRADLRRAVGPSAVVGNGVNAGENEVVQQVDRDRAAVEKTRTEPGLAIVFG